MKALEPEMIFPGEEIVHITGYHWIYVFRSFLPLTLILVFGTIAWSLVPTRLTSVVIMLAFLASIAWIVIKIMDTIVKRCYVTNRRLINRSGWTKRDTQDVTLDRIGGMYLDQTPMERFLGYGRVKLIVPLIVIELPEYLANPIAFRRSLYPKPAEKPEEKPDDETLVEEEARLAKEQADDRFGADTVSLKELQEMTNELEGVELGEELGADLGVDLGEDDTEDLDFASDDNAPADADATDGGGADGGSDGGEDT